MKALSIRQPHAHLVVYGGKNVENRSWWTSYRGPLLIHAAKRIDSPAIPHFHELGFHSLHLRFGGIIGQVDLVDVVTGSDSEWAIPGRYHWMLENPRAIPFREMRGRLGLWETGPKPQMMLAL